MKYRLKVLGWHVLASSCLLLVILGALYLGWYRWPGWYLADMLSVLPITVGVDVAIGPLLTFVIASPTKPLRALARDIAFIALVQLVALVYGCTTLWQGRPLYYAYSAFQITVVQATQLHPEDIALGQQHNPSLAPHWYSLPRWVYARLPEDEKTSASIVQSALGGGTDVTDMPRYYQPWQNGLPELRKQLRKIDTWQFFSKKDKTVLKQRLVALGVPADAAVTMPFTGHGVPLLAVFDPNTLRIEALLSTKP
jgi:hypothetical protein